MMKQRFLLLIISFLMILSCVTQSPDPSGIRPQVKLFLVSLSRRDFETCVKYVTDEYLKQIGGYVGLGALSTRYEPFLKPNLFEFNSPQLADDAYLVRVSLYDGKRSFLPVDVWVIYQGSDWKVARAIWHEPKS